MTDVRRATGARRVAYLDCPTGIAGDMLLAACVDAGCDLDILTLALEGIKDLKNEWNIVVENVRRGHAQMAAKHVTIETDEPPTTAGQQARGHANDGAAYDKTNSIPWTRKYKDVRRMIQDAPTLTKRVKDTAVDVFRCLAEAEAACHGVPVEDVHFDEVGAIDSIIDTVGCVVAFNLLGIEEVYCSDLPFSQGSVSTQRGILPVPSPTTMRVLAASKAVLVPTTNLRGELITPTGASLLVGMGAIYSPPPRFVPTKIGVGAGTKDFDNVPNCLRLVIGETQRADPRQQTNALSVGPTLAHPTPTDVPASATVAADDENAVVALETNVDDMSPQIASYVTNMLLDQGALDVWTSQVIMKKGRPGYTIHVLSKDKDVDRLCDIIFMETTTLGVRKSRVQRSTLTRDLVRVDTTYGPIRVKIGVKDDGTVTNRHPEYEDCKRLAVQHNVPLKTVMNEAVAAFLRMEKQNVDRSEGGLKKEKEPKASSVATQEVEIAGGGGNVASTPEIEILDLTETKSRTGTSAGAGEGKKGGSKNADLFERLDNLAKEEKLQERKDQAVSKRKEGNEWYQDQKYGMAIQCYTEAMQLNPEDVTNVSNRSNAFYAGRFYEESARDARKCIEMDPKFAKGYYRLAHALKDMGKIEEALAGLEEGLKVVGKGKKALQQLKKKFAKTVGQEDPMKQVEAFPSTKIAGAVKESLIPTPISVRSANTTRVLSTPGFASVVETDAVAGTTHNVPEGQGEVSKTRTGDDEEKPAKKMSKFKRDRMKMKRGKA